MVSIAKKTQQKKNPKERILEYSRKRFWESGFSKVTMDELAYELGISKKTLYVHFPNKREMLREALLSNLKAIETGLEDILEDRDRDFAEKLNNVMFFLNQSLPRPSRIFFSDMKRHAHDIWLEIDRERLRIIREHFGKFLESGAQIGILRPELDVHILITTLVNLVQQMVNPDVLSQNLKTPAVAFEEVFSILFVGILTDQGRDDYQETIIAGG